MEQCRYHYRSPKMKLQDRLTMPICESIGQETKKKFQRLTKDTGRIKPVEKTKDKTTKEKEVKKMEARYTAQERLLFQLNNKLNDMKKTENYSDEYIAGYEKAIGYVRYKVKIEREKNKEREMNKNGRYISSQEVQHERTKHIE